MLKKFYAGQEHKIKSQDQTEQIHIKKQVQFKSCISLNDLNLQDQNVKNTFMHVVFQMTNHTMLLLYVCICFHNKLCTISFCMNYK